MLVFDSIRGEHSTGIAIVDREEEHVVKVVGDPFTLFNTKAYDDAMRGVHRVMIGHNRYATQGKINKRNAHPFEVDDLIGVHNGTLTNKHQLFESYKSEVDSEALYHHISRKGLRDAIDTARGAWALVWWDKSIDTINFLRNKDRPLYMAWTKDASTVFWASEEWMLNVALSRNNIPIDKVISLQEDQHLSMEVTQDRKLLNMRIKPMAAPAITNQPPSTNYNMRATPPQKPAGGVVTPFTKTTTTEGSASQINRKNVLLIGMVLDVDSCGGQYLSCYDAAYPDVDFRLYQNSFVDIHQMLGTTFTTDVLQMCTRQQEGVYYKMSGASLKMLPDASLDKDDEGPYFVDSRNKLLTEKEWTNKYQCCSFCTGAVIPGDKNRFTTAGDILCPACATDPQVQALVTIA